MQRALDLGYPLPRLGHNYLAAIAAARGDLEAVKAHFARAIEGQPQHRIVMENMESLLAWVREGGPDNGRPLKLVASHDFELAREPCQPAMPGPLPENRRHWPAADEASPEQAAGLQSERSLAS